MKTMIGKFLIVAGMLLVAGNAFAEDEKQCIGDVCGYNCVSYEDQVKCANTPDGVCLGHNHSITCWDPKQPMGQKAECVIVGRTVYCGYHCLKYYGTAMCAETPYGVCYGYGNSISCWDPDEPTDKKAECIGYKGHVYCGYNCRIENDDADCDR